MSDELGITTAPRDGTRIMVFSGGAWHFVRWSREAEYGFGEDKRLGGVWFLRLKASLGIPTADRDRMKRR